MKSKELGELRRIAEALKKLQAQVTAHAERELARYNARGVRVRKSSIGHAHWLQMNDLENAAGAIRTAALRIEDVARGPSQKEKARSLKLCARCSPDRVCARCRAVIARHVRGEI